MKRVAVIGGGPSGLFSAWLLHRKSGESLDITVLEAGARAGGKIWTRRFAAAPIRYEAGVAELYRYSDDPLWRLVTKELGLDTVPMAGSTVVFGGQVVRSEADLRRCFGESVARALREFRQRGRAARPYRAFYNGGWPADNQHPWLRVSLAQLLAQVPSVVARRYLKVLIHSDLATEPNLTHGLYGIDNYLINEGDYCQLYSVAGGLSRLLTAVAHRLPVQVARNTVVRQVEKASERTYRVTFESSRKVQSAEFDAVVLALPIYALRQLRWGSPLLRDAMDRHVACYEDPGHYLRVTALFREPFWREAFHDSWFIHDAFGGCCVYDEGSRHETGSYGVLSWLLAGNDALALSHCSDRALVARVVDSLPPQLASAALARRQLLEGQVHRWLGMVYGMPGGRRLRGGKRRHCLEPREHRGLILVGDYLFDSTVNGAFDSADIASELLLDYLAR